MSDLPQKQVGKKYVFISLPVFSICQKVFTRISLQSFWCFCPLASSISRACNLIQWSHRRNTTLSNAKALEVIAHLLYYSGCGKTALLEDLAGLTGNSDCITVHIDDQMDSKTLLGAYLATTTPGEFIWQPGLLTQVLYDCASTSLLVIGSGSF